MGLFNVRHAKHGDEVIRVGHDEILRWWMSTDGSRWLPVDDHTLKSALNDAHARLHRVGDKCTENLTWELDERTKANVLGECPACNNPSLQSDLKTFRRCPDCGWRVVFTKEEIEWVEKKLDERREQAY